MRRGRSPSRELTWGVVRRKLVDRQLCGAAGEKLDPHLSDESAHVLAGDVEELIGPILDLAVGQQDATGVRRYQEDLDRSLADEPGVAEERIEDPERLPGAQVDP